MSTSSSPRRSVRAMCALRTRAQCLAAEGSPSARCASSARAAVRLRRQWIWTASMRTAARMTTERQDWNGPRHAGRRGMSSDSVSRQTGSSTTTSSTEGAATSSAASRADSTTSSRSTPSTKAASRAERKSWRSRRPSRCAVVTTSTGTIRRLPEGRTALRWLRRKARSSAERACGPHTKCAHQAQRPLQDLARAAHLPRSPT